WRVKSVSSLGPSHRMSTLKSRAARSTPACMDTKNRWEVALGTTAIIFCREPRHPYRAGTLPRSKRRRASIRPFEQNPQNLANDEGVKKLDNRSVTVAAR